MTKQQRTILTIVLSLVVVAAAVAGGILAVQGTKTEQVSRQAAAPTCPAAPTEVPPPKPAPQAKPSVPSPSATVPGETQQPSQAQTPSKPAQSQATPGGNGAGPEIKVKFMELGAEWCGPCQSMKPVIEQLKKEYKGKVEFVAIDVDENRDAAEKYNVSAIPVQLIFKDDKQVFRHVGVISKEDIVKQFKKLGVTPAG